MTWLLLCHWTPERWEYSLHTSDNRPSVTSQRVGMPRWCLSQVNDHTPRQVLAPPSVLLRPNCLRFSRKPKPPHAVGRGLNINFSLIIDHVKLNQINESSEHTQIRALFLDHVCFTSTFDGKKNDIFQQRGKKIPHGLHHVKCHSCLTDDSWTRTGVVHNTWTGQIGTKQSVWTWR